MNRPIVYVLPRNYLSHDNFAAGHVNPPEISHISTFLWVAIICTIGNIATLQPRLDILVISHVGCNVAKFNIQYLF
jgi:hypothetical protein